MGADPRMMEYVKSIKVQYAPKSMSHGTLSDDSKHSNNEVVPATIDPNTPVDVIHTQHDNGKNIVTKHTFQYARLVGTSLRFARLGANVPIIDGRYTFTIPLDLAPWQAIRLVLTYLHENQTQVFMTRVPKCGFFDDLKLFELGQTWYVFDHGMDIATVAQMYKVCKWIGIKEPFSNDKLHERLIDYFSSPDTTKIDMKTATAILACTDDKDTPHLREMAMFPICQKIISGIKATGKTDEEEMVRNELLKMGSEDLYEIYNAHIESLVGKATSINEL